VEEFEPRWFHSAVSVGHVVRHGDGAVILAHNSGSVL
jgi:hypothetical protein